MISDTPLHQACKQGWLEIVEMLIEKYGCDPNVVTKSDEGLLHYACRYGHINIVKYLINKHHLNPLMRDINQLEPLDYAVNHNRYYIAVYICQHCISSDELLNPNRIKTTINLLKYIISTYNEWARSSKDPIYPMWKTANGNNILQLVGSSKTCGAHIRSAMASETLCSNNATCIFAYFEPDLRTADGDTILQLILRSEMSISRIYSWILAKLLSSSTKIATNEMKNVNPNWRTVDGAHFPHVLCLSNIEDNKVTELVQYYILRKGWNPDTFDGSRNTILHISCQANKLALVSYLINQAQCNSNIENSEKSLPVDMTTDLETINYLCQHDQVSVPSKTIIKWLNNPLLIDDTTMLCILQSWNGHKSITKAGTTILHVVCTCSTSRRKSLVNYLLTECQCDPNCLDSKGRMPLQLISDSEIMKALVENGANMTTDAVFELISKHNADSRVCELFELSIRKGTMLWSPNDLNSDGYTALHLACKANSFTIVNFLLSIAHCDPNIKSKYEDMPIQLTSHLRIMETLIEHGAQMKTDVVFELMSKHNTDSRVCELFELSIRKGTMLWSPGDLNIDGYTALHLSCKANNFAIVNFLLSVAHCEPNVKSNNEDMPIQLTSDLKIMKTLIEHGAQMTTDVVFKLILNHNTDSRLVSELFKLSTTKGTMLWNPNDLDSDGYTALHLACKADSIIIMNYLLSVAQCDPNIKSKSKEVCLPLQLTTNTEIIKDLIRHGAKTNIMYDSHQNPLQTNKPVQPPVKVFVVGNPYVGKSTLTAALKTERLGIFARLLSTGRVSGVDKNTVGIVPHDLESDTLGRVTLYDFAGHREFYSGHAALLQTAIQSTPPIFIIVINLCEDKDDIIKGILYWVSFLENHCASVSCKPHVILVGSHADTLKGVSPKDKISGSLDTNYFTNMEYVDFVAMNCQYHESAGMKDLRHLLIKSCEQLRIQEPITFNAHCFLVYLIDTFIDLPAITIKTISDKIKNQTEKGVLEFLPTDIEALYKICLELNDRGHILLLRDQTAVENSYVVIDKAFLLSEISGTVFAPEGFTQYTRLSPNNSGVVPRSKLANSFPGKDLNIVIGFLSHLEFCHEIVDQALYQLISKEYSQTYDRKERYFLFPGLVSVKAEDSVWKTESHFEHNFGWILKCVNDEQFFSSRFLQVLLLRLAFSFALKVSGSDHTFGIHRKCSVWKNGIVWGRSFNMDMLVEVADHKSVTLMARFGTSNLLKCIIQRSEVILTILECVKQFCPRVETVESFIDSSSALQYPLDLNSDRTLCSVRDISEALVSRCECPSVVLSDSGKSIPAESFLSYEPYSEIEPQILQELWDKENESKIISDIFLSKFVKISSSKLNLFVNIFSDSASVPSSKDDLSHELIKWRGNKRTYKDFRHQLDVYSVFAGRNVLVSILLSLLSHYIINLITIILQ
jgi:ankyrin repeat protein